MAREVLKKAQNITSGPFQAQAPSQAQSPLMTASATQAQGQSAIQYDAEPSPARADCPNFRKPTFGIRKSAYLQAGVARLMISQHSKPKKRQPTRRTVALLLVVCLAQLPLVNQVARLKPTKQHLFLLIQQVDLYSSSRFRFHSIRH